MPGETTTYSFEDLTGFIAHPLVAGYRFNGQGVGEVTVSMATEKSAHDVAADGSVMVSKILGDNGQVSLSCQQTSSLHKWLLAYYNAIKLAPTNQWAAATILLRNASDGTSHMCNGVSPQKIPDKPYQAQGQRVTWVFMCADIQNLPA